MDAHREYVGSHAQAIRVDREAFEFFPCLVGGSPLLVRDRIAAVAKPVSRGLDSIYIEDKPVIVPELEVDLVKGVDLFPGQLDRFSAGE